MPIQPNQQTVTDLGQLVKTKYPGQYDDLDNADLGRRVKAKYPGAYDDFGDVTQVPAQSVSPSWSQRLGLTGAENAPLSVGGIAKEFAREGVDMAEGAASGLASTIFHGGDLIRRTTGMNRVINTPAAQQAMTPPPTAFGATGKGLEQAAEFLAPMGAVGGVSKGVEAATAGMKYAPALRIAGKAAANAVASGGVAALQSGGNPGETATAALVGGGTSAALEGAAEGWNAAKPFVRNQLNPVEQQAMDWLRRHGVPISTGQGTGSLEVQRIEKGLENIPGSAGWTQQYFENQEQALNRAGRQVISQTQPGSNMGPFEAGESLQQRIQDRIEAPKQYADKRYNQVRSIIANNAREVQTGTRTSALVDPNGNPIQVPVMQTIQTPVDTTVEKTALARVYNELSKAMPEFQRQVSPGFQALGQIINGPDINDAITVDRNLSAVKALLRKSANPYLNTQSQRLAAQAVNQLSGALDSSLSDAGGRALEKLNQARAAVKSQHEVAELLASLPTEPVQLYQRIASSGDRSATLLSELNRYAPREMRQIGRTYLDGLMQTATAEGGFSRAPGIMAQWQNMGPRTKQLLFGSPQAVRELDNFFLGAKRLTTDVNPSKTAYALAALGPVGAAMDGVFGPGSIEDKAKRLPMEIAGPMVASRTLSNLLLSPAGRAFLTSSIKSAMPELVSVGVPTLAGATAAQATTPAPLPSLENPQ